MAQRLLTLQNSSGSTVTVHWDGTDYVFAASAKMTLDNGVAANFKERYPVLHVVAERDRMVPSGIVATDVIVTNTNAEDPLDVTVDGVAYHVAAGATAIFDASVADVFAIAAAVAALDMSITNLAGQTAAVSPA